jgi:hypothetical protein
MLARQRVGASFERINAPFEQFDLENLGDAVQNERGSAGNASIYDSRAQLGVEHTEFTSDASERRKSGTTGERGRRFL